MAKAGGPGSNSRFLVTREHLGGLRLGSCVYDLTCHMAKYEVPGTHTKFSDHRIRVLQSIAAAPISYPALRKSQGN